MKHTSDGAFVRCTGTESPPIELKLDPDETLIGWYVNPEPWRSYIIVFTSKALVLVNGGQSDRVLLEDILDYETPASKTGITGVHIRTKAGFRFVRMAGTFGPAGNFKDAFSFIMIIQALRSRSETT